MNHSDSADAFPTTPETRAAEPRVSTGTPNHVVRLANTADVPAAAAVLARSFAASRYPWTQWTVDGDGHEARLRALYELFLQAIAVPYGHVAVAVSNHEIVGAGAWMDSQTEVPDAVWSSVTARQAEISGRHHVNATRADTLLAARRPTQPHLWLATIGVLPELQGVGVGRQLLVAGQTAAVPPGLSTWLETSSPANVRFYQRNGFDVVDTVCIPDGPTVWLMSSSSSQHHADRPDASRSRRVPGRRDDPAPAAAPAAQPPVGWPTCRHR